MSKPTEGTPMDMDERIYERACYRFYIDGMRQGRRAAAQVIREVERDPELGRLFDVSKFDVTTDYRQEYNHGVHYDPDKTECGFVIEFEDPNDTDYITVRLSQSIKAMRLAIMAHVVKVAALITADLQATPTA